MAIDNLWSFFKELNKEAIHTVFLGNLCEVLKKTYVYNDLFPYSVVPVLYRFLFLFAVFIYYMVVPRLSPSKEMHSCAFADGMDYDILVCKFDLQLCYFRSLLN